MYGESKSYITEGRINMPSIVSGENTERCLRQLLKQEGYRLSPPRGHGETGVDIIARKGSEALYIEVIGFKSSPPARSKDFYQVFFRAISRLKNNVKNCVIALPERFQIGFPSRVKQYRAGWERIGKAFPELEIWLINVDKNSYKRTKWSEWLAPGSKKRRVWLVEDNLVALYIALYGYEKLSYTLEEIKGIIPHKGFPMRIQNYIAIHTYGRKGLNAALNSPLFKKIYRTFRRCNQKDFAEIVDTILDTKKKI